MQPAASVSGTCSRRVISGCAQKQPWRTPIAYSSLSTRGQLLALWPFEVEAGDADAVVVDRPQGEPCEAVDGVQAGVQAGGERALAVGDRVHADASERLAGGGEGDGADHVRRAGLEALGRLGPDDVVERDELDRAAAVQQRRRRRAGCG